MTASADRPETARPPASTADPVAPPPARKAVTPRALLLGLTLAALLAAFTPFNDYVLNNTPMFGSALPTAPLLALLALVLLNLGLQRLAPARVFSPAELTVVLALMLVAGSVPAGGVMRYLVGNAIGLQHLTAVDDRYRLLFESLELPDVLFPNSGTPIVQRAADPVVRDFIGRIPLDQPSLWTFLAAIPWSAWLLPILTWGTFFLFLATALLAMAVLVRRQWVENERLPFPIATVYLALLEPPAPGAALNPTLGRRSFWLAAAAVFTAHAFAGLYLYFPRYVPQLPLGYDLTAVLADGPWRYVDTDFKQASVLFSVIGITYFLSQKVAFSLVFFYVAFQLVRVVYGRWELDFSTDMQRDQLFGALFPYAAAMLYVARGHLAQIARAMLGRRRPDDPVSRYLPDALAGYLFLGASLAMVVCLLLVGVSIPSAFLLVTLLLLFFLIVARVVAETGIPYVGLYLPLTLPLTHLVSALPQPLATKLPVRDFFVGQLLYGLYAHDHRESLPPLATHALRVADETFQPPRDDPRPRRQSSGGSLLPALGLSIALAFVVSFAAWLVIDYRYAGAVDKLGGDRIINQWGTQLQPQYFTYEPTLAYANLTPESHLPHNRAAHVSVGAGVMTFLAIMRLRYEACPFHPVGFLLAYTLSLKWVWFSIFLGYLAKALVLKLGGASFFRRATPFFLGLILGEAAAAGFWLLINIARFALGYEFSAVKLLPG